MKNIRIDFKKIFTVLVLALTLFVLFAVPSPVKAQTEDNGDKYVVGGRFRLRSDETINGNLFVLGGTAILEQDSVVNGDVILVGGTLEVSGAVNGDVNAMGGTVKLLDQAEIHGDVNLTSVSITTSPYAVVDGNINENAFNFEGLELGQIPDNVVQPKTTSPVEGWVDFVINILWAGLRILAISAIAALVVLLAEKPTERVKQSIVTEPVIASAFGLLTAIVAPALLLLLTITIILIPVALIGLLALVVAGLFGWVAIGYEVGKRIEKGLKQSWAPAINAGVGAFFLSLVSSLFSIIPCIGWIIPVIISVVGIGGVMISRFGTTVYVPANKTVPEHSLVNQQDQVQANPAEKPHEEPGPQTSEKNEDA